MTEIIAIIIWTVVSVSGLAALLLGSGALAIGADRFGSDAGRRRKSSPILTEPVARQDGVLR